MACSPFVRLCLSMSDVSIAVLQAGVLIATAFFSRSRLLLAIGMVAVAAVTVVADLPESLQKAPIDLATSLVGVLVGGLLGIWAARARRHRPGSAADQQQMLREQASRVRRRGMPGRGRWIAAAAVLAGAAGAALYVEGNLVASLRATVAPWIDGAGGTARPAPTAASDAAAPAKAASGQPSKGARHGNGGKSADARTHGAGAGSASPGGTGSPSEGGETTRPRVVAGDLRHCLSQSSSLDVVRCAEQRN